MLEKLGLFRRTKRLAPLGLLLAAVIVAALVFTQSQKTSNPSEADGAAGNSAPKPGEEKIDLSPPTEEEVKQTEEYKKNLGTQDRPSTPAYGKISVTPVITSADENVIRSYVPGVNEDGGTCTATFKQYQSTFAKQTKGFRDASTTICAPINLQKSDFSSTGEWSVVLTYESTEAKGSSAEIKFNVD
jgi:hypothetical protein